AYKACELTRLLVKAGHEVIPLVTPSAERFVRAETFTALAAGNRSHGQTPHDLHTAPTSGALGPPTEDLYAYLTRAELLVVAPSLAGKRVLVTAGGTREPVDSVRFLGNRSSGRMGVALAEEARRRGAEVTLLAANLAVPAPAGVETIETPTAGAMLAAADVAF